MAYILETERLKLREFTTEDGQFIIALLNSPGWIEFIGDRNVRTEEQAIDYLQNGPMKSYQQNGFGLSLVELKDAEIPVGMCGIIRRDNLEHPDIGFAFLPEYTGKGLAFEIATATMKHAREQLKLPVVFGITVPYNTSSIKLLEKLGLTFVKMFYMPDDPEELMLFSSERINVV